MAPTLRLSDAGLTIVDEKRRLKGWNKQDQAWADMAFVSVAVLRSFWKQNPIQQGSFESICRVLFDKDKEIDPDWQEWQEWAEVPSPKQSNAKGATGPSSQSASGSPEQTSFRQLTATEISQLAFAPLMHGLMPELSVKLSSTASAARERLQQILWEKLQDKSAIADLKTELEQSQTITTEQLGRLAAYLQVAMDEDPDFAIAVQQLAQTIQAEQCPESSGMVQNNSGQAKGWQTEVKGGTAYIGEIHIQNKQD
jgi:hypothetical protein